MTPSPVCDLGPGHRTTMRRALAIAAETVAERPRSHWYRRPTTRFSERINYDGGTHRLGTASVRPTADHGILVVSSDAAAMRIDLHPFNREERTPLLRIAARHLPGAQRPVLERASILSAIGRAADALDTPEDPLRYERKALIAAVVGSGMHAAGIGRALHGENPKFALANPWRPAGLVRGSDWPFPKPDAAGMAAIAAFDASIAVAVAETAPDDPGFEVRIEAVGRNEMRRLVVDLTADRTVSVAPIDAIAAMRRIAWANAAIGGRAAA